MQKLKICDTFDLCVTILLQDTFSSINIFINLTQIHGFQSIIKLLPNISRLGTDIFIIIYITREGKEQKVVILNFQLLQ